MKHLEKFSQFHSMGSGMNEELDPASIIIGGFVAPTIIAALITRLSGTLNRRGLLDRSTQAPPEQDLKKSEIEDLKTIDNFVENYVDKYSDKVYAENEEEIQKIENRIKPGIDISKKMRLCFKIFELYWDDLKTKGLNNVLGELNMKEGTSGLIIASLYKRLELDKLMGVSSPNIETDVENTQRFMNMVKNNLHRY